MRKKLFGCECEDATPSIGEGIIAGANKMLREQGCSPVKMRMSELSYKKLCHELGVNGVGAFHGMVIEVCCD